MNCNQKDNKPEIEKEKDKIHDLNLASTNTQFQETQGQDTSNIHEHIQNQEQQCLQRIDFYQGANDFIRSDQSNERDSSRKTLNNLIQETNNNLCYFNINAPDQRLPNYINRADQQPDRQFQDTQTIENVFLPRQAQQEAVTSSINLPKTQLKSFSGDPLRWHDWFSFFKATIHNNVTLTNGQRMTYLQNALTDRAKESIIGYSYNGVFYNEAMQELQKGFGKPQHDTAAYLDKLEHWPRPTINNPESFVSFAAFHRQMVQTFILHNFTSDLQSSAVLKIAKDKLVPTMIIRWNEYVLRQAFVQPNLIHIKYWIDNYAEACEDLSTSQRPFNQENSSSRRSNKLFQQQSNKRCPLCGCSHNLRKCNQFLNKDINERQQTVRQLKICPNCLTEHPKDSVTVTTDVASKSAMDFSTELFTETTSTVRSLFHQISNSKGTNINNKQTTSFKTILQTIITTIVVNTIPDTKHR